MGNYCGGFMKRFFLLSFSILFCFTTHLMANNLSVSTPVLVGRNVSAGTNNAANYVYVKCDISWDNSWKVTGSAPNNWDAAWVFVKYKVGSGDWQHATLNLTQPTAPSGSVITPSSDGKGIFIYRSGDGTGSVNFTGMTLRWNYGADGVTDASQVTVKVFGVEMVYVPTGSFYVGTGGQENGSFTNGSWVSGNSIPIQITSEGAITIGQTTGDLWAITNNILTGSGLGSTGTLAAAFPKGYNAFYCMKYSISQEQYVDFLNSLTYNQQVSRTVAAPNSSAGTNAMFTASLPKDRNSIRIITSGVASTTPAVYGCDLDSNGVYNQANDGQNISCNWLSWADGIAFSDWSALRPMTELEFEKACRGPSPVVLLEYAWGNSTATAATATSNGGQVNESVTTAGANSNYGGNLGYPVRVGIFAGNSTTRAQAGASYYGIMDLSGDVLERCVTLQGTTGRSFTGSHGDGALNSSGDETGNTDWPGTDAVGAGFRGGPWDSANTFMQVSDRGIGGLTSSTRGSLGTRGFRSVRTAP